MPQWQRTEAVAAFKAGTTPLLIATDVAARGLDIPGVECVINYRLHTLWPAPRVARAADAAVALGAAFRLRLRITCTASAARAVQAPLAQHTHSSANKTSA